MTTVKQARPGIRFQYTGRVSAAHVAHRVHPGRITSDGGAKQPRITSDGGAKQPRYGIRFQYTGGCPQRTWRVGCILDMSDGGARQPRIMYDGGPGMQSHHTHCNFLFGMVHLPPSGGTRWVII
ncbi:hypothetical protein B0H17DRAFT_1149272 [Mycena rosella]|uniref:Uncharacterized protein n=1 Tax=Mycena rosella TaxID=1033263 RepID=A0AAD7C330_MYCRO|nr:hypothetical protein B0H17DRAFT_1149272 [Mycena rosella]